MLYNDFRPQTFKDMIGQNYISEILKNQVKAGKPSHAYLFCGTRGTGKTTSAKILAKAVNCLNPKDGEPCNECEMCRKIDKGICTDVVEIDAASHNGVDDIRSLIDTLKYPAAEAKYRVYILDEVHMLTQGAVNAFLKTLEEPPENVIFILATTDPQKLPVTILSRCQKFDFRRIKVQDIFERLKYVSEKSSIKIDDKGVSLIAKLADGAMRDALSILDQVKSLDTTGNGVQYDELLGLLGAAANENLFKITENIFCNNTIAALNCIDELDENGKDFNTFIKDLIKFFRNCLMTKVMGDKAVNVIPMAEEDIKKLSKISDSISNDRIMDCIRILQDTEVKAKTTSQIRVTLELSVIEMTKEKAKIQPLNNKYDKLQETENKVAEDGTVNMINTLKQCRVKIITALKNNKQEKFKELGSALEKSKMAVSNYSEIKISAADDNAKQILEEEKCWIIKGFSKYLEKPDNEIKIVIS